jgi:hypothetical protein
MLSQISSVYLEDVVFQLFARAGKLSDVLEWSEVDAILQHSKFSRLRSVEVRRGTSRWHPGPAPDPQHPFSAQVIERLPRCHARGIFLR